LPPEIVEGTTARYVEAYERITGEPFDDYRVRTGAGVGDEAALERLREGHG